MYCVFLEPLSAHKEVSSFYNQIQIWSMMGKYMYESLLHFEYYFRGKAKRKEEISRETLHWENRDCVIEQRIFCPAWKTWAQMRNGHFQERIAHKRVRLEKGTWEQWRCAERDTVPLTEDTVVSHILPSAQNNLFLPHVPSRANLWRQFFFIWHSPTRVFVWFNVFSGNRTFLGIESMT